VLEAASNKSTIIRIPSVPEDELEKLRLTLLHAYDKPKPLTRRIIEAMMNRTRAPKKSTPRDSGKEVHDEDAA